MKLTNLRWSAMLHCLIVCLAVACQPSEKASDAQSTSNPPQQIPEKPNILFMIADDWSYQHASVHGDPVVRTPNFDFLSENGASFHNAFCATPSCTPSRAAILTGRHPHQLEEGGNLWGFLPKKYPNYTELLENDGYAIGRMWKGWSPGDFTTGGYERDPAGHPFDSFEQFMEQKEEGKPFCFWVGFWDPHRPYEPNLGEKLHMDALKANVPACFPDSLYVRKDILDYFFEIERLDRYIGKCIDLLEAKGELENTMIVVTSDNGMPFPRCKANLYDMGTRMPLAIYWKGVIEHRNVKDGFVNLIDMAPTFLEAAGLPVLEEMVGKSILPYLLGKSDEIKDKVFIERERHAYVRENNLSYPMRAVRNSQYLYINNLMPERTPAGDSVLRHAVGPYGDADESITKDIMLATQGKAENGGVDFFELAFGQRPAEELYNVVADPYQLNNLAGKTELAEVQKKLSEELMSWRKATDDPRLTPEGGQVFENAPYYGGKRPPHKANKHPRSWKRY